MGFHVSRYEGKSESWVAGKSCARCSAVRTTLSTASRCHQRDRCRALRQLGTRPLRWRAARAVPGTLTIIHISSWCLLYWQFVLKCWYYFSLAPSASWPGYCSAGTAFIGNSQWRARLWSWRKEGSGQSTSWATLLHWSKLLIFNSL